MSKALSTRPGGDDPATAGIRDITRAVALITQATGENGELISANSRSSRLSDVRQCLAYLRPAGLMPDVPDGFTVTREHRIKRNEGAEPSGRALPDRAMAIILNELNKVAPKAAQTGSLLSVEVLTQMHMAAMRTLIDTGRRPNEVCALRVGCVSGTGDSGTVKYILTYDNTKSGRNGRTLPITADTCPGAVGLGTAAQGARLAGEVRQVALPDAVSRPRRRPQDVSPRCGNPEGLSHLGVTTAMPWSLHGLHLDYVGQQLVIGCQHAEPVPDLGHKERPTAGESL